MNQEICSNCKQYQRRNAWSGTCGADGHDTSPGRSCEIGRFELHGAIALDKPLGSYPRAMLRNEFGTVTFADDAFQYTPGQPTPVEVLAVVGLWAMVRNVEPPGSFAAQWSSGTGLFLEAACGAPYVTRAVLLDYGSAPQ